MSIVRRVAKNTAFLAGSEIVHKVLFFFLIIYATNVLGAEGFGRYSFAFAFGYLFTVFCTLGVDVIIIKEVSRDKKIMNEYFSGLLSLRLLLSFVAYISIIITIFILGYDFAYMAVILIVCLSVILDALSDYFKAYFQADERMEYGAIAKIVQTIIIFVFGSIALYLDKGLIWFVSAFLISSIANFVLNIFFVVTRFVRFDLRIDLKLWIKTLKAAAPLALSLLFGVIYFRIDTLMLSFLKDDLSVGIYNSAFQIIAALLFIPGVFLTAIFPLLSSQYKLLKDSFLRTTDLAMKVILIIAIPIAFGMAVLAPRIIDLLYTPEYFDAAILLQILSFVMIIIFMNYVFYNIINSIDRHKIIAKVMGICFVVNIILNYFMIIRFDAFGAAIATLLANLLACFLYYWYIKKDIREIKLFVHMLKPLISGVLMVWVISQYLFDLSILLIVPMGAAVYFISLLVLRTFKREEFRLVLEIVGIKK